MGQSASSSRDDASRLSDRPASRTSSRRSSVLSTFTGSVRRTGRRMLSRSSTAIVNPSRPASPVFVAAPANSRDERVNDSAIVDSVCAEESEPAASTPASLPAAPVPAPSSAAPVPPPSPPDMLTPARRIVVQGTISSMPAPAPLVPPLAPVVPPSMRATEEALEARTAAVHPSSPPPVPRSRSSSQVDASSVPVNRPRSASLPTVAPVVHPLDVPTSPPSFRSPQSTQGNLIARLLTVAAATTAASLLPGRIMLNGMPIQGFPGIDGTSASTRTSDAGSIEPDPLREAIRQAIRDSSNGPSATATAPAQSPAEPGFETFLLDLQTEVGSAIARTLAHRQEMAELMETPPMEVLERLAERWDQPFDEMDAARSTSLSFFRMHRFADRQLQLTPTAGTAEAPTPARTMTVVPVLLVGVRSLASGETAPMLESMAGVAASRSTVSAASSTATPTVTPEWAPDEDAGDGRTTDDEDDEDVRSSESAQPTASSAVPETLGGSAYPSWLIWIAGGVYQPNHPLLSMPALLSGFDDDSLRNGDAYDELLRLAELLGSGKPLTTTQDALNAAGLDVVTFSEAKDRVEACLGDTCTMCQICREDWAHPDRIRLLKCRHAFHADCVDTWLCSSNNACPVCRTAAVDPISSTVKASP